MKRLRDEYEHMHTYIFLGVFAVGSGSIASMITAVLADFVNEEDKGRGAGLVGAFAGACVCV